MAKAIKRPLIQSDSEDSDFEQEPRSLTSSSAAKRAKPTVQVAQSSGSGSSSDSDSDAEWTIGSKSKGQSGGGVGAKKPAGSAGAKKGRGAGGGKIVAAQQRKSAHSKKAPPPSSSESSDEEEDEDEEETWGRGGGGGSSSSSSDAGSSSDSENSMSEFDDGLDDKLQGDAEDQHKLSLMTETEREQEMYKRYEKREAMRARFEIEQKLRRHRREKKHNKKLQKEKQKRSLRYKRGKQQDRTKTQAMDEYKAKRSADKLRKAEAEKEKKEPLKASDVFTSESEEEYSSTEGSDSNQKDSDDEAGAKSIAGLKDSAPRYISTGHELGKIRLSRYRLEKWVHMPFFTEAVVGCYVRIGIGAHEGRMVYRICEIIGVQETPKVYTLGTTKTNKGLKLRHALQERIFRMEYVSNSQFTDTEFAKWKAELEKRGLKLPTVDYIRRKARKLEEVKNVSLKEEDVEKIIQENKKFKKNPSNYAMTKSRLIREKETAEQDGDVEKARNLGEKLSELEERADQLDKQRSKGLSAISYINERNRQRNVTRAELALKEELAAGEGKADDPFTRRKCQPTLVTLAVRDSGGAELVQQLTTQAKAASSKGEGNKMAAAAETSLTATPNGQSASGLPGGSGSAMLISSQLSNSTAAAMATASTATPKSDQLDDLFSAHDFDIQIDLPSGPGHESSAPKAVAKSSSATKQDGPRRSLNLSDYKKRRGLI